MSEYNKLYNDFMNLATEVGELETENKNLKHELEIAREVHGNSIQRFLDMNKTIDAATQDLLAYETANLVDRFKYFLTGKMS